MSDHSTLTPWQALGLLARQLESSNEDDWPAADVISTHLARSGQGREWAEFDDGRDGTLSLPKMEQDDD